MQIADVGLYAAKKAGRDQAMIGEVDGPTPAPRPESSGEDAAERTGPRPAMQEASYEEDPRPSGVEIR